MGCSDMMIFSFPAHIGAGAKELEDIREKTIAFLAGAHAGARSRPGCWRQAPI